MAASRPMVSVCVPVYNGAAYLERCLASVRAQTFADFELIVVDDGSSDGSAELAAQVLRGDPRAVVARNPRRLGLVGNWNHCVGLARGLWVKFLFQDDLLRPACLERMLAAAGGREALVVCRRSYRFEDGVPARVRTLYRRHLAGHGLPQRFPGRARVAVGAFARALRADPAVNFIGEPTAALVRRDAFARFGSFNPRIVSLCDWELLARVAVNTGLRFVDESLAVFRVHEGAESAFNRSHRAFRSEVLDELVIRHELAYAPAYAAARAASRGRGLREAFARSALGARAVAGRYPGESRRELADLAVAYPRIGAVLAAEPEPPAPVFAPDTGRRRELAAALLRRHLKERACAA